MATVFIGLGSNIDAERNLREAARFLRKIYSNIVFSAVYKTAPLYEEDQDFFLNAVARIETDDNPQTLFMKLRSIEKDLHKEKSSRFGPRTIDMDLLLHSAFEELQGEDIVLPHPRMHERRFVLEPLLELLAGGNIWQKAYEETLDQSCDRTDISL